MTKDEVLGMIILGKVPPGAIPGPGAHRELIDAWPCRQRGAAAILRSTQVG